MAFTWAVILVGEIVYFSIIGLTLADLHRQLAVWQDTFQNWQSEFLAVGSFDRLAAGPATDTPYPK